MRTELILYEISHKMIRIYADGTGFVRNLIQNDPNFMRTELILYEISHKMIRFYADGTGFVRNLIQKFR